MSGWEISAGRTSVDSRKDPDASARRRAALRVASARLSGAIDSDVAMVEALDMLGILDAAETR